MFTKQDIKENPVLKRATFLTRSSHSIKKLSLLGDPTEIQEFVANHAHALPLSEILFLAKDAVLIESDQIEDNDNDLLVIYKVTRLSFLTAVFERLSEINPILYLRFLDSNLSFNDFIAKNHPTSLSLGEYNDI